MAAVTAGGPQWRLPVQSAGKLSTGGVREYFTREPEAYSFESHSAGSVPRLPKTMPLALKCLSSSATGDNLSYLC